MRELLDFNFACTLFADLIYLDEDFARRQWQNWSTFADDCAIIRLTGGFVEY